jgi:hypothetical protein
VQRTGQPSPNRADHRSRPPARSRTSSTASAPGATRCGRDPSPNRAGHRGAAPVREACGCLPSAPGAASCAGEPSPNRHGHRGLDPVRSGPETPLVPWLRCARTHRSSQAPTGCRREGS